MPNENNDNNFDVNFSRIGKTGLNRWGGTIREEFLNELKGQKGVKAYEEMEKNDPVIGAFLFAIRQLVRQAKWRVEAQGESEEDKKAKIFLEECIEDLDHTWDEFMDEVFTFLTFGFSLFEIVYKKRNGPDPGDYKYSRPSKFNDGRIGWDSFSVRGQNTVESWDFDDHGALKGLTQKTQLDTCYLPYEKIIHFRTRSQKANPEGRSILRTSYIPYYYKKNIAEIEAIGIERDLAGLPVLTPAEGLNIWDSSDPRMGRLRKWGEELVTNIRRDEQEGILKPHGWELELLGGGGKRQFDTDKVIKRYDQRMAVSVLSDFLLLGSKETGSYAMSVSKQQLFQRALDGWLESVAETFNKQAVDKLFELNTFDIKRPPHVVAGKIESPPIDELGDYVKKLSNAGFQLFPNEALEEHLLSRADLPSEKDLFEE